MRYLIPAAIFFVIMVFLAASLDIDPRLVPSPLIDKPAPEFELSALHNPQTLISKQTLLGRVIVLNIWASWCSACRTEHPLLVRLAQDKQFEIVGLNYKDERNAAEQWLVQLGDPYVQSIFDPLGRLGLDLGVYGVPETFVIDAAGIIRFKHIGPITQEILDEQLLPLVAQLQSQI